MDNHPFHRLCDCGVPFAPVAVGLPAGLRSLSPAHPDVPSSLLGWTLAVRLAVATVCFAGGFVCAWFFVHGLDDVRPFSALATFFAWSLLAISSLALASKCSRGAPARAFPGFLQQAPAAART